MPRRVAQALSLALLALCGCESTDVWVAYDGAYGPGPCGTSWATVLPGPVVFDAPGDRHGDRWYDDRCDDRLSPRPYYPVLATRDWPHPARPTLERPRYVHVVRSPYTFIHYRTGWPRYYGHRYDYHWHDR